nr:MFS transporter [Neomicrococcus lactis]
MGGFGIGATEFTIMGLVQEGSKDLGVSLPAMGVLISAYALGVVVGAPILTAMLAKAPRKTAVIWLMVAFTVFNSLSFFAPTYELIVAARFLSGLPHGAYFGLAAILAASFVAPTKRGSAIAWVMMGLSVANVVGVPFITWLGQNFGWRWMFASVAFVGALTLLLIILLVPNVPALKNASVRTELSALKNGQVWMAIATGVVGFGGFFAMYSYISPIATDVAGISLKTVPVLLALYGVGMVIGNWVGGKLSDISVIRTIVWCCIVMIALQLGFGLTAHITWLVFIWVPLLGIAGSALVPSLQALLMDSAPKAQALAASLNHSSLNTANALGALLGAAVLDAGFGLRAPMFLGAALAVLGLILALLTAMRQRKIDAA